MSARILSCDIRPRNHAGSLACTGLRSRLWLQVAAKLRGSSGEPVQFESVQHLVEALWGVVQGIRLALQRGGHDRWMEADEMDEELIGGLCLDAVPVEDGGGKVALVVRHDHLCSAPDRGGKDMAVIGVGKAQRADEVLIARDQAVWDGLAHLRRAPP